MAEFVLTVLGRIWLALAPLKLPMAVMGGIAVSVWKHVRATQDVDVLVYVPLDREEELLHAVAAAGFRPKRVPVLMNLGEFRLLQLLYEPPGTHFDIQVDLLLASSEYHREALARSVPISLSTPEFDVSVLTCEDLILHKLVAGRILDQADVAALIRANSASLDREYLVDRARQLGVTAELISIWQGVLPDVELP